MKVRGRAAQAKKKREKIKVPERLIERERERQSERQSECLNFYQLLVVTWTMK